MYVGDGGVQALRWLVRDWAARARAPAHGVSALSLTLLEEVGCAGLGAGRGVECGVQPIRGLSLIAPPMPKLALQLSTTAQVRRRTHTAVCPACPPFPHKAAALGRLNRAPRFLALVPAAGGQRAGARDP